MLSNIRFFVVFALLIAAIGVRADEGKSFSRQMNEIKRSGDYVYAESSAPSEADAKAACDALLKIEITKYLVSTDPQSQTNGRIVKNIADYDREYLVQPRSDMVRVFGYVAKKSISTVKNGDPEQKSPTAEEKAEKKEEPRTADEKTVAAETAGDEKKLPPAPPAATSEEIPSSDVPDAEPESQSQVSVGLLKTEGLDLAKWQIDMLENIVGKPDMVQAKKLLNRYKSQNRIKRLGAKSVPNPRPADSFYLIFDSSNKPAALLAPSSTVSHYDMISGSTVRLDNYSGNQFFWFQISK